MEDPGGLLDEITDYQLCQWIRYAKVEPFGEERDDLRSGVVAAAVINSVRGLAAGLAGKRDYETVSPHDFVLTAGRSSRHRKQMISKDWWKSWKAGLKAASKPLTPDKR